MIDETGNRYGRLIVVAQAPSQNGARWKCRCDCGSVRVAQGTALRLGRVTSCGCAHRLPKGEASRNALYKKYKRRATKMGVNWNLSVEQFDYLVSQDCFYCGQTPEREYHHTPAMNGAYVCNGIDRIDNDRGYTYDNLLPACWQCNRAKGTLSLAEFQEWLGRFRNNEHDFISP